MSFTTLNSVEYTRRFNSDYVQDLISSYKQSKIYTELALKERTLWEQDKANYDPRKAPEEVRELCTISHQNYKLGIAPYLNHRVEFIPTQIACRLCRLLGGNPDEPALLFAEKLLAQLPQ